MRVVGGELGGRRLHSPPRGAQVRPTSDRVREALFSIIGARVQDARVLDLCCGTGALAIESISRGAVAATLVDDDTRPARANIDQLGIAKRCRLVRSDVVRFLGSEGGTYELIFCDPPYRLADRLRAPLQSLVPPLLAEAGLFIVESAARQSLSLELPVVSERRYGDTRIAIYGGGENG